MKTVSIIRQRGQLTIPDSIRKVFKWITPQTPVSISAVGSDQIIIEPHQKKVDWDKLWKQIQRVRAFKGKGRGNLSTFIAEDRESRR